jgi:hypothetical protein
MRHLGNEDSPEEIGQKAIRSPPQLSAATVI